MIRDIEFRIPVQVSILSERRVYHPYGLEGGDDAECGLNLWVKQVEITDPKRSDKELREGRSDKNAVVYEERRINLGGKNTAAMKPGERIIVCTPGGGGWGPAGEEKEEAQKALDPKHAWKGGSFHSREETALQA